MRSILVVIAILTGCFIFFRPVIAQDSQQSLEESLLPEIDPQDIEIRSQFQARFPGLRRQPILGFNPRPRVFQVDPNRMPYIEDLETVVANLPIGELSRPEPPEYDMLGYATPKHAFMRAGIGSYLTPEIDAFATARISKSGWLSTDMHFTSSEGHDENVDTSYRIADIGVKSYNRLSDKSTLVVQAGALSNFNNMLQLNSDIAALSEIDTRVARVGFHGSADVDIAKTTLTGINVSVNGHYDEFNTTSGLDPFEGTASEGGVDLSAHYSRLGNHMYEIHSVQLQSSVASTSPLTMDSYTWSVNTLSANYERLFNYKTDVQLSLGASAVTDAVDNFIIYFTPRAEIKHTVFRGLEVRGEVMALPTHQSYSELQSENRFFNVNSTNRHQYEMRALGEIEMEPFYGTRILAGAIFQDVKNYLYYTRTESPMGINDITEGYYSTAFADATIFKVYGGFSQDLKPEVLWFNADGYWQIAELSDGSQIPFTESLSLKAALSFRPKNYLLLEGWGEFAGGREDYKGERMSSFVLIGGRFELSLTENIGVYGKLLNLLNEKYKLWQGFEERGFQGYVGFTFLL